MLAQCEALECTLALFGAAMTRFHYATSRSRLPHLTFFLLTFSILPCNDGLPGLPGHQND